MDYTRIEELLQKYWECETTLEEEKELRTFFQQEEVPDKWKKEAALFGYFKEEREEGKLGEFFDHRILEEVNQLSQTGKIEKAGRIRRMWQDISKVAAVILVLFTAVYFAREQYIQEKEVIANNDETRAAFEETKKALMMVSRTLNKGTKQVGKMAIFNEAQDIVRDDITEMDSVALQDL